uniref:Peptidase M12B domain-containing protein n=1 Tax=Chelonoidis abingdonii TaxID=106734 RepID=A0A8C0G0T2_CHEAB
RDVGPAVAARPHRWTHATYIEFCVVVEKEPFVLYRRNENIRTNKVLCVINMVDSFYHALGAHVILIRLESWTENNLITLPNSIGNALTEFNRWRNDMLYHCLQGHAGRAYVGGICLVTDAASIVTRHFASVPFFSVTVAHGHNLGMYHHYDKWHCNRSVGCIMAAVHITTDQFTDCSREVYFNLLHDGAGFCLCNIPAPSKIFRRKHCGNKVMEGEEECDCGSELECKKDVLSGKLCRAAVDECDLPEYCNRTSKWCQEDDVDLGYCYQGRCHNHNKQCADIFGGGAQKAPLSCFSNLNTRGDRFGNCASGETGANYKKITGVQTPMGHIWRWGTDHHAGPDVIATGAVKGGTLVMGKFALVGHMQVCRI